MFQATHFSKVSSVQCPAASSAIYNRRSFFQSVLPKKTTREQHLDTGVGFHHWACGFGIFWNQEWAHDYLYYLYLTVIFASLTIIIVITTIKSTFKQNFATYQHLPSKLSYFLWPCFAFPQPPFFVLKSWPNFCNNGNKLHGPLWPTVLKSSGTLLHPPTHPLELLKQGARSSYMENQQPASRRWPQ